MCVHIHLRARVWMRACTCKFASAEAVAHVHASAYGARPRVRTSYVQTFQGVHVYAQASARALASTVQCLAASYLSELAHNMSIYPAAASLETSVPDIPA